MTETVAGGLSHPWSIAFLPNGSILITERPKGIRLIDASGTISPVITGVPPFDALGEGGMLDVALDPKFKTNQTVYWSYAEPTLYGSSNLAVAKGRLVDGPPPSVANVQVIFRQMPALNSRLHFGSRLVFGRDGKLFVTQGDRHIAKGREQVQRMDSLVGKLARIDTDGSAPLDNPFLKTPGARPEIWSIGHRNIQAAAIHPITGELWTVEHGARGGDEINIIHKGRNYGWPLIAYGVEYNGSPIGNGITDREGYEKPLYYWDPVIAPSGLAFYNGNKFPKWKGSLFVGGLKSRSLVRLAIDGTRVIGEERLLVSSRPMPIRDVKQGPDGGLYVVVGTENAQLVKLVPSP